MVRYDLVGFQRYEIFCCSIHKLQSKLNVLHLMIFFRILDHVEEAKTAKQLDMEEGENIKKQVDMYMAAKQAIEEERRKVMV